MSIALGNGSLLDNLLALGQDELDVARVGHVRVDLSRSAGFAVHRQEIKHTRPWAR